VQAWISRAAVAVEELRCDESVDVDLGDAAGASAGERRVVLLPLKGVGDGAVVTIFDDLGDGHRRDGPQRRHTFHWCEGDVVSGNRSRQFAAMTGDVAGQFAFVQWCAVVFGVEHVAGHTGADLGADVLVDRRVPVFSAAEIVVAVRHGDAPL